MIILHRLGRPEVELHVNPDLIVTIEATPDTVISLASGSKMLVSETPAEISMQVVKHRVAVLAGALENRREERSSPRPELVACAHH